jgi:multiple sugar transport system permease protein
MLSRAHSRGAIRAPTLDHLRILFGNTLYLTWLFNTLWVGALVVLITLLLGVPAAYGLARLTGRWGERMSIGIFLTYLIPSTLLFIPFARLVASVGLQNQLWALVLIYPTFTVPFCTWLLMGFLKTLPKEVEESAMVDGCSWLGAIGRVVLPLAVPGLLTMVIFALTLTIQEFVYSLTFISSVGRMTVSVGLLPRSVHRRLHGGRHQVAAREVDSPESGHLESDRPVGLGLTRTRR